jgi:heat shock protein HslJ
VVVSGQDREPWILLEPHSTRATGFGGCNGISGRYDVQGQSLRFGPMIRTQMACPSLDTENAFLRALEGTRRYRLRDPRSLELLDASGRVLARLEERNPR